MITFKELRDIHVEIGLWDTPEKRSRYGYVLSPEVFVLDKNLKMQLNQIGFLVKDYLQGCLKLSQSTLVNASGNHSISTIYRLLSNGLNGLPFMSPDRTVPLCKVDLMIDNEDNFKIAEIDAYNHRGIAYAIFLRFVHEKYFSKQIAYDGVLDTLFPLINETNANFNFSYKERYYSEVFKLMQAIFKEKNIDLNVVCTDNVLNFKTNQKHFIVPDSMQQVFEQPVKDFLLSEYSKNPENFLYPLIPWIGNKGILGLIKNPMDETISSLVKESFDSELYFNKYLPDSVLLFSKNLKKIEEFKEKNSNYVFKKNIASGMKGVWLDTSKEQIHKEIDLAIKNKNPIYSLQEKINQKKFSFKYFTENGEIKEKEFYIRLIAHVNPLNGDIVDIEITARPEPDVHGAPDCLQIPCVF